MLFFLRDVTRSFYIKVGLQHVDTSGTLRTHQLITTLYTKVSQKQRNYKEPPGRHCAARQHTSLEPTAAGADDEAGDENYHQGPGAASSQTSCFVDLEKDPPRSSGSTYSGARRPGRTPSSSGSPYCLNQSTEATKTSNTAHQQPQAQHRIRQHAENADSDGIQDATRQHRPCTTTPRLRSDAGTHVATTAEPEDKSDFGARRRRYGNPARTPCSQIQTQSQRRTSWLGKIWG
jgi:hypothetical protein